MSNNNNSDLVISLDYSNKQLSEFPEELYNYKSTLVNLDISANPLLNLDKTINALTEFTNLKQLKINIETGEEAKKLIDALPNLMILNDHPIHEEEEEIENDNENDSKEILNNNNNENTKEILIEQDMAQLNYNSINSNKEDINDSSNNNVIKNNEISNKNIDNIIDNNICNINQNINSNNNSEKKIELKEENKFEYILNKIKEYSEITKEK